MPSNVTYVTLFAEEDVHLRYESALERFRPDLDQCRPMYIGGDEVKSDEGEFDRRSPIDSSIVVGHFQRGTKKHARLAIAAANRSFKVWSRTPWQERVRVMLRAADLIDERNFEIAAAITYEVGKTRLEALAEVREAIDTIRYYAKIMEQNEGYTRRMDPGAPGEDCRMVCKPYGAWVIISPFNFPFMLANGMALGALVTGNTVILKPTSEAPLTGLMLYRIYRDAGVPAGVVNYVTGPGANFEEEFTSNPSVAGIAFTGSRDVGMELYHRFLANQPYPKLIVLEMGSKNPSIVTASADLEEAVEGIVRAAYGYSGQKCSATSRVYVENSVKAQFLDLLKVRVEQLVVADPRRREVSVGPLINQAAVDRFARAIEEAGNSGGIIIWGGHVLKAGDLATGYYVEPTIIVNLPSDHRLFREELFVPLLVVDEFKTLDEALRKANDTDYGLTAGIFTENPQEIQKFLDEIQFGMVYANRAIVVSWNTLGDQLTIWASNQWVHLSRTLVANYFRMPVNDVIIKTALGGYEGGGVLGNALGNKSYYYELVVAAVMSQKANAVVKYGPTRFDQALNANHCKWPIRAYMNAGATRDGKFTALDARVYNNVGAYGGSEGSDTISDFYEAYMTPNMRIDNFSVNTNAFTFAGPMRDVGESAGHFFIDTVVDMLAEKLGVDPAEFRLKNMRTKDTAVSPVTHLPYTGFGEPQAFLNAMEAFDWKNKWKGYGTALSVNGPIRRGVGVGLLNGAKGSIIPPSTGQVQVDSDGTVTAFTGLTDHGAGGNTAFPLKKKK